MRLFIWFAIILGILGCAVTAEAANPFYIDFAGGSDSNDGLTTTTAWKHAPGMTGVTGVPAAINTNVDGGTCHDGNAGCNYSDYQFIFRGGVTWDHTAFQWVIRLYGTSGHPVYFGVDMTWYSGASWTRPIFDAGGTSSGTICDPQILMAPVPYIVLDNFENINIFWDQRCDTGSFPANATAFIFYNTSGHEEVKNMYVHAWSHGTIEAGTKEQCWLMLGSTEGIDITSSAHDNVFDGTESLTPTHSGSDSWGGFDTSCSAFFGGPPILYNNYMLYVDQGQVSSAPVSFYQNTCHFTGFDFARTVQDIHDQCYETNGGPEFYFYNNFLDQVSTGIAIELEPLQGTITYAYNNVIVGVENSGNMLNCNHPANLMVGGTCKIWNNTIHNDSAINAVLSCSSFMDACLYQNNHLIGDHFTVCPTPGVGCTENYTLNQTTATATSQGYTSGSTFPYDVTSMAGGTVGAGVDLSSNCMGLLSSLCGESTVGVGYDTLTRTVIAPNNGSAISRPATPDIGAYQFSAGTCTPDHVLFTSQPQNTFIGSSLGVIEVKVYDSGDNFCDSATNVITLAKNGSATWGSLGCGGSNSQAAIGGVMTRSDCVVNATAGIGSIDASSSMLTGDVSDPITITLNTITGSSRTRMHR